MVLRVLAWALLGIVVLLGIGLYSINDVIKAPYMRDQIVAQVQKATGRTLTINGDMAIHWGLFPRLSLNDISLSNAPFDTAGPMVQAKTIDLTMAFLPLIFGDVVIDGLDVGGMTVRLTMDPKGNTNWTLSPPAPQQTPNTDAQVPQTPASPTKPSAAPHLVIRNLSIRDSVVVFTDQRTNPKTEETLDIANLTLGGQAKGHRFSLTGGLRQTPLSLSGEVKDSLALLSRTGQSEITLKGTLADVGFTAAGIITKHLGALSKAEGTVTLNAPAWPKAFPLPDLPAMTVKTGILYAPEAVTWTQGEITSMGATVTSSGIYRRKAGAFDAAIQAQSAGSPDLATRFQVPLLQKPLSVKGRFQKKGDVITWSNLKGTLGTATTVESDGTLRWPQGAAIPTLVQADLRSPLVVLADLQSSPPAPAPAAPSGASTLPEKAAQNDAPAPTPKPAPQNPSSWRQYPVYPAVLSGLRGVMTARVDHVRETATGPDIMTKVTLRATKQDTLGVEGQGHVYGDGVVAVLASLTPQPETPAQDALLTLLLNVTHPDGGALLKTTGVTAAARGGAMHLLANVKAAGATVQNLLETLSGDVTLGMGPATLENEALLSTLVSGDLARALLGDQKTLPVSCLATKWPFVQGVATTPVTLLESPAVRVWGTGTLNLARNTVAMTLTPTPKDPKLALLAVPVSVSGALDSPRVSLGKQGVETLTNTVLSLIQNKGKLPAPTNPLPANDTICANVLIPLKDGRFEVRGVSIPSPQTAPEEPSQKTHPLKKKEILEGLRGLWR
jgi:uncharacterized protein involved in outer membrane biogenesis